MMSVLEAWFRERRSDWDQDAVQEAVARCLEFQTAGGTIRNAVAFLEGTVRNVKREEYRHSRRFQQAADPGDAAMQAMQADPSEGAQEKMDARLDQVLSTLSPEDRKLLRAYFACKRAKDRQKLAAKLGVNENCLYTRVHRLKRRLEKAAAELEDAHDG